MSGSPLKKLTNYCTIQVRSMNGEQLRAKKLPSSAEFGAGAYHTQPNICDRLKAASIVQTKCPTNGK